MPDPNIRVVSIWPEQLTGVGDGGNLYDTGPFSRKFLAQGDSWFSIGAHPPWATSNLFKDMFLSKRALVVNCAHPGHELERMVTSSASPVFLNLLAQWPWDALLISGGGNDLIAAVTSPSSADRTKRLLLTKGEWRRNTSASRYLSEEGWNTFAKHMRAVVDQLLQQRDNSSGNKGIPVFFHTYDYVTPRDAPAGLLGPWLCKAMLAFEIPSNDWDEVSDELINRHADMWLAFGNELAQKNVRIVDSRGATVRALAGTQRDSNDWENEIHPTPQGYALLARKWRLALDKLA